MIYWQVSTCLLSITQSIIPSQLDPLKLLSICSFLIASHTFTRQLKLQFLLLAIFLRIMAETYARIFLLKPTRGLDCTHYPQELKQIVCSCCYSSGVYVYKFLSHQMNFRILWEGYKGSFISGKERGFTNAIQLEIVHPVIGCLHAAGEIKCL